MSVRGTVTRNTLFNTIGRAWDAVVSLILIAYIVATIGTEQYGLWAIVGALTGYATLFDVGLGSAYGKYIAEHRARDEDDAIAGVVSTGLMFYTLFAAVFVAIAWPCVELLLNLLGNSERFGDFASETVQADLAFLLRWGLVLFAASNLIAPFTAMQTGFQRMDVTNGISALAALVKLGATLAFLEAGFGVRGLIYANAAVLGVFAVLTIGAAFRLHPRLRIGPRHAGLDTFRRLFAFGWRTQVSRLANLVMFETDVLVIAIVLRDLQLAGLYRIGIELANKLRQVPAVMLSALMPAASDLHAREETQRLRGIYIATTKYVAVATVPAAVLLASTAGAVMTVWQGAQADMGVAANVLRIMAIGYLANMLPGAGVAIALGMGRADLQMRAGLISMVANLVLTVVLALTIGFWGIPLATALSMALSWAWFAHAMRGAVGVSAGELLRHAVLWPAVASMPVAVVGIACEALSGADAGRGPAALILSAGAAVAVGAYLVAIRYLPAFTMTDLHFFDETLRLSRVPGYRAWSRAMRTS